MERFGKQQIGGQLDHTVCWWWSWEWWWCWRLWSYRALDGVIQSPSCDVKVWMIIILHTMRLRLVRAKQFISAFGKSKNNACTWTSLKGGLLNRTRPVDIFGRRPPEQEASYRHCWQDASWQEASFRHPCWQEASWTGGHLSTFLAGGIVVVRGLLATSVAQCKNTKPPTARRPPHSFA